MEWWQSGQLAGRPQRTLPSLWFLHDRPSLAPREQPVSLFERMIQPCVTGLVLSCCLEAVGWTS